MASILQSVSQTRVDDIVNTQELLAERISIALDPEFALDSDIDERTLESLRREVNALKQRTERPDVRELLTRHGKAEAIRNGLHVMKVQLQDPREAGESDDLDFPSAIPGSSSRPTIRQPSVIHAGLNRTSSAGPSSSSGRTLVDADLEPASGPQRRTPSTRVKRDESNTIPRRRLTLPSDCQNFDVVFLPFKSDCPVKLPDQALCMALHGLKSLGLHFHVRLPRQGSVQKYLDCQVKSFCEDQQITLESGVATGITDWVLMKRTGKKATLEAAVLTPYDFTVATLAGSKLLPALPNYLSDDGGRKLLMIAPVFGNLSGAITLEQTTQMGHRCHISRFQAAVENVKEYECSCANISASASAQGSQPAAAGRTLA
ncbi:hypothetical protein B0H15DRAFT_931923 [Mycena belliarum]|uniref:Uncharacterized protein n=1 Tax=Mycena belliarum TaxID=1033014 RepID=A0AAD6U3V2_9AGAR|nr:hypothetical protein B0H15DRAFT_931923 [Mycena belliae]